MMDNASELELAMCAREPIRVPGAIQPHGFLLALRATDHVVMQVSANAADFTGRDPASLCGLDLRAVAGEAVQALLDKGRDQVDERRVHYLGPAPLPGGQHVDVLAHLSDGLLVLEFEPVSREAQADFRSLYPLIGSFLSTLSDASDIETMTSAAVREIHQLTGFGRVLLYRFDEEGHGQVLAESLDPGYHSYLHQWFPASDVPPQARELYVTNRVRLIPDADYQPAALVPELNPLTGEPTDLSLSALRSVSPVHLRYMRNMGTGASMSVSIVVRGELWGLISCHHAQPRAVPFEARAACEQLARILALRVESREDLDDYNYRLGLRERLVRMLAAIGQASSFMNGMRSVSHDLLGFASATGAAIVFEGEVERIGDAPPVDWIQGLVQWLAAQPAREIHQTRCLAAEYPEAAVMAGKASGLLAISVSQIHRHWLLLFRPEIVQTLDWAGNPHEKQATPSGQLTPRRSFAAWQEVVRNTSLPWRRGDLEIAQEFRTAVLGVVLEKAEQMAELAEELGRANKELEAFSYSVSHDLRAPMRHIVGFTDLLLEYEGEQLSERGKRFLRNIRDSAGFAGKLVDDLLSFSQMGRAALRIARVDMNELVQSQIQRLGQDLEGRKVRWAVTALPTVQADPAFLNLAVLNLLSNAIKYTRDREEAIISVSGETGPDGHVIHITDNGVGFSMEYAHKLFGVFQRLHRMEDFEGTGIGLANVRRIIERHGGRVWAEGKPDQGAIFSFSLPLTPPVTGAGDKHAQTNPAG